MAAAMRIAFILLVVLLSVVQHNESARIPRDDAAAQEGPTSDLALSLQSFLDDFSEKFRAVVAEDSLKKMFADLSKTLNESGKAETKT